MIAIVESITNHLLSITSVWKMSAKKLGFDHPISGEFVEFESDYPVDLEIALNRLRDVNFRL